MIEGLRRVVVGPRSGPWLLGAAIALVVAGPVLAPGMLLNLDLVLTPEIPVPAGVWGLGPELPRRLPFFLPMAWLSTVIDGATVGKVVMVLTIATAFAGAHRLATGAPPLARIAAGLAYAAGPFLVTRLAVGHLGIALAAAVLPWALPHLLRPADNLARTLLWCAALGACGINGGILAGVLVLVGLVAERGHRTAAVVGAFLVGQLPWLVPGVVVSLQGVAPAGADAFDTRVDGVVGLLRLTGGQGFWIPDFDIGGERLFVPLAALVLVALAAIGHRHVPAAWRGRALVVAAIGLLVAAASGLPGVDGLYRDLAGTALGQPLREGHRILPLFLVWLAPAAAFGSAHLGRRREQGSDELVGSLLALAAALALAGPGLWGFGGQLDPVDQPAEWAAARDAVLADPGPVLAVPWGQYVRPTLTSGNLVHHPLPFVFGGDVLIASGQGADGSPDERADPRLGRAGEAAEALERGDPAAADLSALGVRWVVVLATLEGGYLELADDPSLELAVSGPTLALYAVEPAPGLAVTPDGEAAELDPVLGPLARIEGTEPATWFRPGASGWLRGLEPATVTAEGNLALPGAAGPVWYWPSLLVLLADGITAGAVLRAWRRVDDPHGNLC